MATVRARIIEAVTLTIAATSRVAAEGSAKTNQITAGTLELLNANMKLLDALTDADDASITEVGIITSLTTVAVLLNKIIASSIASGGDVAALEAIFDMTALFDAIKNQKDRPVE